MVNVIKVLVKMAALSGFHTGVWSHHSTPSAVLTICAALALVCIIQMRAR